MLHETAGFCYDDRDAHDFGEWEFIVLKLIVRDICLGLGASIAFASMAVAELENENLLVAVPQGYKVDFQRNNNNLRMTEMVPLNESVKDWTEMVTVQVLYRLTDVAPEKFKSRLEQQWSSVCPGSQSKSIKAGTEGGYPSVIWAMTCKLNPTTNKPENTWFRAIQGADSFYLVQKAYKFTPTKAQESQWVAYLQKATVCDTRVPERPCPETKP
jgi:hypothetical protein